MPIKNAQILSIIERISEHYQQNIANRYLRKAFTGLTMDKGAWEKIEKLTEGAEYDRIQGYTYTELYDGIYNMALFIRKLRNDVAPNLRTMLANQYPSGNEKLLMDMAVSNFNANLGIFVDMVNELYMKTIELDKDEAKGKAPLYTKMPELADVGKLLIQI
ncbi:MAG: hypothetical protein JEZ04_05280 [Spirochaetales bacterium]|nr:hypothetical protein [Spirochaetales bacterium]